MKRLIAAVLLCALLAAGCGRRGQDPGSAASSAGAQADSPAVSVAGSAGAEAASAPETEDAPDGIVAIRMADWPVVDTGAQLMPADIWAAPRTIHHRGGSLYYFAGDSGGVDGTAFSLSRLDLATGETTGNASTHTGTRDYTAAPAFLEDRILVLADSSVLAFPYNLAPGDGAEGGAMEETPLHGAVTALLDGGFPQYPAFSRDGTRLLMNDSGGLPVLADWRTGAMESLGPVALNNGFVPVEYSAPLETRDPGVFAFTAMGEEPFPYYEVLFDANTGRVVNYLEVGPYPEGAAEDGAQGSPGLCQWIDLTANTFYRDTDGTGHWMPTGIAEEGLAYKVNYGTGLLEVADFSARKVYTARLGDPYTVDSLTTDGESVWCVVNRVEAEPGKFVLTFPLN